MNDSNSDIRLELRQIRALVAHCGHDGHASLDADEGRLDLWAQGDFLEARFRGRTVCLADPQIRVWVNGLWQRVLGSWYTRDIDPPGKRPGMEDRPLSRSLLRMRQQEGTPSSGIDLIVIESLRRWEDGENWPELHVWIRSVCVTKDQLQDVANLIGTIWALTERLRADALSR